MKLIYWIPSFLWMGLIFYLSSRTGGQLHSMFPILKSFDWGHLVAYFILSIFFALGITKTTKTKKWGLIALSLCVIYGITDEYHQSFVPSRTPDIFDLINDTIGAGAGVIA
jgi:VanZ family protein